MESVRESLWVSTRQGRKYAALQRELEVDVAVVGGGLTGLTTAALLSRGGKRVALLEARGLAEGVSGFTTAHLTEVLDTRYHQLIKDFGEEGARLARESSRAAIDLVESLVRDRALECDFERIPGFLFAEDDPGVEDIEREVEACRTLGMDPQLTSSVPLPFSVKRAARFEGQAQFHPRAYLLGLAERLQDEGVAIFENTRVLDIEDGTPCLVTTTGGRVKASEVIIATHSPVATKYALYTRLYPYRSYVLGAPVRGPELGALLWDTAEPYHYIRTARANGGVVLLVGGEVHKVGHERDTWRPYARLETWARKRFDMEEVQWRWSAQVIETPDGLPFIGHKPLRKHILLATGYAGNGMTFGTVSAMLMSALVLGRENPWTQLYSPSRKKPLASAREFLSENADVSATYLGDRLTPAEHADTASIPPGEGAIVEVSGHKRAVYKDPSGALTILSPVCPHLGCHVKWNDSESSWDCPCHGSRYEATGEVIDGPSVKPLETIEVRPAQPSVEPEEEG